MSKFELGQVVETKQISEKRKSNRYFDAFVRQSFERYSRGDWGDTSKEDSEQNDQALKNGERILAFYIYDLEDILNYLETEWTLQKWVPKKTKDKNSGNHTEIWITTEWDRSATTILFPNDY